MLIVKIIIEKQFNNHPVIWDGLVVQVGRPRPVRPTHSAAHRTALHHVNGTVTGRYYLNNTINAVIVPLHEQHSPNFILTDDNAPAHRGRIIGERLLETGVPQMEWSALSPELNPIENLWEQLRCHVQARNPRTSMTSMSTTLHEEWDAMPQQTISPLVNSMRRRCQAVIDAQGHVTSYWDLAIFCCHWCWLLFQ